MDPFAKEPGVRLYKMEIYISVAGRYEHRVSGEKRDDHRVKIRGYRLKLGKWRTDLVEIAGIKEAVVTVRGGEKTGKYLCAYVTGEEKTRRR
ncbi:hypothetical protein P7H06_17865 [Paenibacillus larvae]|nr:hypothetical protein [Paenibacillus larvae]MDT2261000.1 hypothetical protein [Paenibacillus larvae]